MQSYTLTTSAREQTITSNYLNYGNPTFLTSNASVWSGATIKIVSIDANDNEFDLATLDETDQPNASFYGAYQKLKISLVGGNASTNIAVQFNFEHLV